MQRRLQIHLAAASHHPGLPRVHLGAFDVQCRCCNHPRQRLGDNVAFSAASPGLPGVTRSFASFDQAAQEAGRSRVYGGIHYEFSNQAGQAAGRQLAAYVLDTFNLTADTQAPKVILDQASPLVTNHNVTLTGQVLDNLSGAETLQVRIDGADALPVAFDQNGQFSLATTFATDGTADGSHTLAFIATDHAGNAARPVNLALTLDTKAPTTTIVSLTDGATVDVTSRLTGAADPTGSSLIKLAYVFDGGQAVPVSFVSTTGEFDDALDLSKLNAARTRSRLRRWTPPATLRRARSTSPCLRSFRSPSPKQPNRRRQ